MHFFRFFLKFFEEIQIFKQLEFLLEVSLFQKEGKSCIEYVGSTDSRDVSLLKEFSPLT
jgi:hypothetical protein